MSDTSDHPIRGYVFATLLPLGLISAGAVWGASWAWGALVYMTLFTFFMDQVLSTEEPAADLGAESGADHLSVTLALAHFGLLPLVIWGLSRGAIGTAPWVALFVAASLFFGQVSNSNAHELIHRGKRALFGLGKWVYISLLFGHHTSAHNKVHHRYAASDLDPNSARAGEGFYRFALRAWPGSFRAGYRAEMTDLARRNGGGRNPYLDYVGGALALMALALLVFGPIGMATYIGLAAYAQMQLLLSDYVQHYGLRRETLENGKLEPMGPQHSWNAPHWYSRHLMLNAPRHSDHHAHPSRPYPALRLDGSMPRLPSTLPAMAALALFPPLWKRVMNRVIKRWEARDV